MNREKVLREEYFCRLVVGPLFLREGPGLWFLFTGLLMQMDNEYQVQMKSRALRLGHRTPILVSGWSGL